MKHWILKLAPVVAVMTLVACGQAEFSNSGSSEATLKSQSLDDKEPGPPLETVVLDPSVAAKYPCADGNPKKVLVCHVPPGNAGNAHEICIGLPAVSHHLALHIAHSDPSEMDRLGHCVKKEDRDVEQDEPNGSRCDQEEPEEGSDVSPE